MKMDELAGLAPQMAAQASPEIFQQLGHITRQLHDTLQTLGVMPKLQIAADGLPDARSRLNYIANKTADAANKVLNLVDSAKAEHQYIADETRRMEAVHLLRPLDSTGFLAEVSRLLHNGRAETLPSEAILSQTPQRAN